MAHEELALRSAAEIGAWSIAAVGAGLLALAVAAELVRRVRSGSALVALADRLLPTTWRRAAAAVVTILAAALALAVPSGARADEHHTRSWLVDGATSSTSTPSATPTPVPTSGTTSGSTTTTTTVAPVVPVASAVEPPARAAPTQPVGPPRPGAVVHGAEIPAPVVTERPPPDPPQVAATAPAPVAAGPTYTVAAGDCLWSIAARVLGRNATSRAIDRGWRAIYAANRDAVGADPNLIHPGLVLGLPPLDPTP